MNREDQAAISAAMDIYNGLPKCKGCCHYRPLNNLGIGACALTGNMRNEMNETCGEGYEPREGGAES